MKKILIIFVSISIFTSCYKIDYTTYTGFVFNKSSASEILVEYETLNEKGSVILHNDVNKVGFYEIIYSSTTFDGEKRKYTQDEFEGQILDIKLSVINGTDTIPLSKNFAPFENWQYNEHYDDFMMQHEYFLKITDDMLD